MTIGTVARRAGVNLQTVRYYQRRGLIEQPSKPPSGYRRYNSDVVERIRFVKRAQELGFSLAEIGELLELGDGRCDDVRQVAEGQRALVARRIADLAAMQDTLDALIERCRHERHPGHCPLIESLSRNG
ncbi:MerR family DNA-binding protein [Salinisphaera sp. P385]|uniref:Mercuric resistance operon regulatory protein n=1 Tax=Spectribacter acetivorans TaxID=3075603 RepID=A0ABU3B4W2_9GAMM|nr:MerR family DNA-binding protein [Salinisphaera sp. P385]MDT0617487.1 MerR family DNA-binding protein [Salinisphaera sp. P385]